MTDTTTRLREMLDRAHTHGSHGIADIEAITDAIAELDGLHGLVEAYHEERQRIRALVPECCGDDDDLSLHGHLEGTLTRLRAEVETLTADRVDRLSILNLELVKVRSALSEYADPSNWIEFEWQGEGKPTRVAREALKNG